MNLQSMKILTQMKNSLCILYVFGVLICCSIQQEANNKYWTYEKWRNALPREETVTRKRSPNVASSQPIIQPYNEIKIDTSKLYNELLSAIDKEGKVQQQEAERRGKVSAPSIRDFDSLGNKQSEMDSQHRQYISAPVNIDQPSIAFSSWNGDSTARDNTNTVTVGTPTTSTAVPPPPAAPAVPNSFSVQSYDAEVIPDGNGGMKILDTKPISSPSTNAVVSSQGNVGQPNHEAVLNSPRNTPLKEKKQKATSEKHKQKSSSKAVNANRRVYSLGEHVFTDAGCYVDKWIRAMPTLEGNHPLLMDANYKTRSDPLQKCAEAALDKGFKVFALQNGGQCYGGEFGDSRYNMYGSSSACKDDGLGGTWANEVYMYNTAQKSTIHNSKDESELDEFDRRLLKDEAILSEEDEKANLKSDNNQIPFKGQLKKIMQNMSNKKKSDDENIKVVKNLFKGLTTEPTESSTTSSTSTTPKLTTFKLGRDIAHGHKPPCICPDKTCSSKLNLAFVIDAGAGSEQGGKDKMAETMEFGRHVASAFNVAPEDTHVGLITYATDAQIMMNFHRFSDADALSEARDAVRVKPHTGKYTGQALALAKEGLFDSGHRPDALDVVVLMTDGTSSDDVTEPARALRDMGVKIITVGIGPEIDRNQLNNIASDPDDEHVFTADYDNLATIIGRTQRAACVGGVLKEPMRKCKCNSLDREETDDRETAAFYNVYKSTILEAPTFNSDALNIKYNTITKPRHKWQKSQINHRLRNSMDEEDEEDWKIYRQRFLQNAAYRRGNISPTGVHLPLLNPHPDVENVSPIAEFNHPKDEVKELVNPESDQKVLSRKHLENKLELMSEQKHQENPVSSMAFDEKEKLKIIEKYLASHSPIYRHAHGLEATQDEVENEKQSTNPAQPTTARQGQKTKELLADERFPSTADGKIHLSDEEQLLAAEKPLHHAGGAHNIPIEVMKQSETEEIGNRYLQHPESSHEVENVKTHEAPSKFYNSKSEFSSKSQEDSYNKKELNESHEVPSISGDNREPGEGEKSREDMKNETENKEESRHQKNSENSGEGKKDSKSKDQDGQEDMMKMNKVGKDGGRYTTKDNGDNDYYGKYKPKFKWRYRGPSGYGYEDEEKPKKQKGKKIYPDDTSSQVEIVNQSPQKDPWKEVDKEKEKERKYKAEQQLEQANEGSAPIPETFGNSELSGKNDNSGSHHESLEPQGRDETSSYFHFIRPNEHEEFKVSKEERFHADSTENPNHKTHAVDESSMVNNNRLTESSTFKPDTSDNTIANDISEGTRFNAKDVDFGMKHAGENNFAENIGDPFKGYKNLEEEKQHENQERFNLIKGLFNSYHQNMMNHQQSPHQQYSQHQQYNLPLQYQLPHFNGNLPSIEFHQNGPAQETQAGPASSPSSSTHHNKANSSPSNTGAAENDKNGPLHSSHFNSASYNPYENKSPYNSHLSSNDKPKNDEMSEKNEKPKFDSDSKNKETKSEGKEKEEKPKFKSKDKYESKGEEKLKDGEKQTKYNKNEESNRKEEDHEIHKQKEQQEQNESKFQQEESKDQHYSNEKQQSQQHFEREDKPSQQQQHQNNLKSDNKKFSSNGASSDSQEDGQRVTNIKVSDGDKERDVKLRKGKKGSSASSHSLTYTNNKESKYGREKDDNTSEREKESMSVERKQQEEKQQEKQKQDQESSRQSQKNHNEGPKGSEEGTSRYKEGSSSGNKESSNGYKEDSSRYKEESNRYKEDSSRYKEESNGYKDDSSRYKEGSNGYKEGSTSGNRESPNTQKEDSNAYKGSSNHSEEESPKGKGKSKKISYSDSNKERNSYHERNPKESYRQNNYYSNAEKTKEEEENSKEQRYQHSPADGKVSGREDSSKEEDETDKKFNSKQKNSKNEEDRGNEKPVNQEQRKTSYSQKNKYDDKDMNDSRDDKQSYTSNGEKDGKGHGKESSDNRESQKSLKQKELSKQQGKPYQSDNESNQKQRTQAAYENERQDQNYDPLKGNDNPRFKGLGQDEKEQQSDSEKDYKQKTQDHEEKDYKQKTQDHEEKDYKQKTQDHEEKDKNNERQSEKEREYETVNKEGKKEEENRKKGRKYFTEYDRDDGRDREKERQEEYSGREKERPKEYKNRENSRFDESRERENDKSEESKEREKYKLDDSKEREKEKSGEDGRKSRHKEKEDNKENAELENEKHYKSFSKKPKYGGEDEEMLHQMHEGRKFRENKDWKNYDSQDSKQQEDLTDASNAEFQYKGSGNSNHEGYESNNRLKYTESEDLTKRKERQKYTNYKEEEEQRGHDGTERAENYEHERNGGKMTQFMNQGEQENNQDHGSSSQLSQFGRRRSDENPGYDEERHSKKYWRDESERRHYNQEKHYTDVESNSKSYYAKPQYDDDEVPSKSKGRNYESNPHRYYGDETSARIRDSKARFEEQPVENDYSFRSEARSKGYSSRPRYDDDEREQDYKSKAFVKDEQESNSEISNSYTSKANDEESTSYHSKHLGYQSEFESQPSERSDHSLYERHQRSHNGFFRGEQADDDSRRSKQRDDEDNSIHYRSLLLHFKPKRFRTENDEEKPERVAKHHVSRYADKPTPIVMNSNEVTPTKKDENGILVSDPYVDSKHFWPFDTSTAILTQDIVTGSKAILMNGASIIPDGYFGNTASTHSKGSYIILGDFNGTCFSDPEKCLFGGMTVSFWVKFSSLNDTQDQYILSSGSQSRKSRGLAFLFFHGEFVVCLSKKDRQWKMKIPKKDIPLNKWINIAFVWRLNDSTLSFFMNGRMLQTTKGADASRPELKFTIMTIGRPNNAVNQEFMMPLCMSYLALWETSLTEKQIEMMYTNVKQKRDENSSRKRNRLYVAQSQNTLNVRNNKFTNDYSVDKQKEFKHNIVYSNIKNIYNRDEENNNALYSNTNPERKFANIVGRENNIRRNDFSNRISNKKLFKYNDKNRYNKFKSSNNIHEYDHSNIKYRTINKATKFRNIVSKKSNNNHNRYRSNTINKFNNNVENENNIMKYGSNVDNSKYFRNTVKKISTNNPYTNYDNFNHRSNIRNANKFRNIVNSISSNNVDNIEDNIKYQSNINNNFMNKQYITPDRDYMYDNIGDDYNNIYNKRQQIIQFNIPQDLEL